ncbi:hypothetical protein [Azospirillum sp. TSO22-1]|uniref:hypothetical protein n=1 Tax=Azospirillum sp. TSO22-1 TaxID=716789 RepID=UPI000D64F473|nr:hypothetical protein [Azospirillum sp. TSO22-1]
MAKTIVALYDRAGDAKRAVDDLTGAGVPRDAISLVASHPAERGGVADTDIDADRDVGTGTAIATTLGGVGGAMLAMAALAIPGVGAAVAVGPIAAGLIGAGAGAVAGGLIGSLTGLGVPEHEAHAYTEGVERGGTLLIVHTDRADPGRVTEVLARHPPADVRTPGGGEGHRGKDALVGRGADWRTAAWAPFDQSAGPMEVLRPGQAAGGDPSRGAHPVAHADGRSGADWGTVGKQGGARSVDDTQVGQCGTSPGTRGGATAFGGIERVPAKTGVKTP